MFAVLSNICVTAISKRQRKEAHHCIFEQDRRNITHLLLNKILVYHNARFISQVISQYSNIIDVIFINLDGTVSKLQT
jgi:hypothetical protein